MVKTKKICDILHVLRECELCHAKVWSQPAHKGTTAFICKECAGEELEKVTPKDPIRKKQKDADM